MSRWTDPFGLIADEMRKTDRERRLTRPKGIPLPPPSSGDIVVPPTLTGSGTGTVTLTPTGTWLQPLFPLHWFGTVSTVADYIVWGQVSTTYGRLPVLGGVAIINAGPPFLAIADVWVTAHPTEPLTVSLGAYAATWPH